MQHQSDAELLRRYARQGAEAAFNEIVASHAGLVYSAALRQLDLPDLARDVAQSVFIDLARKARVLANRFSPDATLVGWLYRSTRFAVLNVRRRRARERQAMEQVERMHPDSGATLDWQSVRPLLDEAMCNLGEEDRDALLLRFFKNEDFRAVGVALGISDDAAQKRVSRALEKLRQVLAHKGITTTAATLSVAISTNAVPEAPVGFVAAISSATLLTRTPVQTSGLITAIKSIAMTTSQKTVLATALAVIAAGTYEAHQNSLLRNQIQTLQQEQATLTEQIAGFKSANESLSNRLWASRSPSLSRERLRELLRLRAEVGALRRRQLELEQAAAQSKEPRPASRSIGVTPLPSVPAPFQVQLVLDGPGEDTEALTNNAGEMLNVQKTPLLDHTAIRSATVNQNTASGAPEIDVEFSQEGKELFAAITRENINKRLAIVLNGQVFSAPVIRSEIPEGKAQITGRFTQDEATELAARINDAIRGQ